MAVNAVVVTLEDWQFIEALEPWNRTLMESLPPDRVPLNITAETHAGRVRITFSWEE